MTLTAGYTLDAEKLVIEASYGSELATLALSLAEIHDVEPIHLVELCEVLRALKHLFTEGLPHPNHGAIVSFRKAVALVKQAWNELGDFETTVISVYVRMHLWNDTRQDDKNSDNKLLPDPDIASIISGMKMAGEELSHFKPSRGRPRTSELTTAVWGIRMFWCLELRREFSADFGPGVEEQCDPSEDFYPQNQASRFCCDVLRAVCNHEIQGKSISYAMIKANQRAREKGTRTKSNRAKVPR